MKPREVMTFVIWCAFLVFSVIDLVCHHYWSAFITAFIMAAWIEADRRDR